MQKKNSEFACLISLCIFLILTLAQVLFRILWNGILPSWWHWAYCGIQIIVLLLPSLILCRGQQLPAKKFLRLRPYKIAWLPATLFGAVTATLGAVLLNFLLYSLPFSSIFKPIADNSAEVSSAALFLSTVLIPAVFEELFIHGAVMSSLKKRTIRSRVFITALIFAMLHSSGVNFLGPFFAAVIYGYLSLCYGSVWPAIIAHFINNMLSDFMNGFVQRYVNIGINGYIIVFALILFLISLWIFCSLLQKQVKRIRVITTPMSAPEKGFPVVLGIFIVCWAVKITLNLVGII